MTPTQWIAFAAWGSFAAALCSAGAALSARRAEWKRNQKAEPGGDTAFPTDPEWAEDLIWVDVWNNGPGDALAFCAELLVATEGDEVKRIPAVFTGKDDDIYLQSGESLRGSVRLGFPRSRLSNDHPMGLMLAWRERGAPGWWRHRMPRRLGYREWSPKVQRLRPSLAGSK